MAMDDRVVTVYSMGGSGDHNGQRVCVAEMVITKTGNAISANGNRIDWDNGTYWIRNRVY